MRLIDADTLYDKAEERYKNAPTPYRKIYRGFVDDVADAPAVDAARVVHGIWIYDGGDEYVDHYHCGECGAEIDLCCEIYVEPKPNYCKNCGAKMDLQEKEDTQ